MNNNMKFNFLLKIYNFVFLICICYLNKDKCYIGRHLEKEKNIERTSVITFHRLLAKKAIEMEFKYVRSRENVPHSAMHKKVNNTSEYSSSYGKLSKKNVNYLDEYKKSYNHRYSRKTGLAKLDCRCEKKIFDKIDEIYELSRNINNTKKAYKKKLFKKYITRFIIFSLLPFLGIIFPILFGGENPRDRIIPWTSSVHRENINPTYRCYCEHGSFHIPSRKIIDAIYVLNMLIFYTLLIIVILGIIYTFIKVIKYEKLKAGKGKMNAKEYYHFFKDVFNNKIN